MNKVAALENDINKSLNLRINLEFFYCDGKVCGVGAQNFSDRNVFPLIHDSEL